MRATIERISGEASRLPDGAYLSGSGPHPSFGLWTERLYPLVAAVIAGACGVFFEGAWLLGSTWRGSVLGNSITALSIVVAYLATAVTVIPAIEHKAIVGKLRQFGYLRFVVRYLAAAIWSSGLLLLASIVLAAMPDSWSATHFNRYASALWWALVGFTLSAVVRALRLLIKATLAY